MNKNTKILIIEDNFEQVKILNMQLGREGYEVVNAEDAVQAVSVAQQEKPKLILLDIGLPGGDGFLVMNRLSKLNVTKLIPVIVITGQDDKDIKQQALDAGAVAYLVKPIEIDCLTAEIQKALGRGAGDKAPVDQTKTELPRDARTNESSPDNDDKKPSSPKSWKDLIKRN